MGMENAKGKPIRRSAWAAAVATALLLSSLTALAGNLADREYDNAVRSFRAGRTSEAFGQFMGLANRGDVDSARIALFLHSYGPILYGKQWDASPQEVGYWRTLVASSGTSARPPQDFQPTVLTPGKGRQSAAALTKPRAVSEIANVARN